LRLPVESVVVVSSTALGAVVVLDTPRGNPDEAAIAVSESRKDPSILLSDEAGEVKKPCSPGANGLSLFIGRMLQLHWMLVYVF
jgi:hypothetical protein